MPATRVNGIASPLADTAGNTVNTVPNVYYADKDSSIQFARYWKNGVVTNLTSGLLEYSGTTIVNYPTTTGIFVSGNDVYLSGLRGYTQALYWKNGTPVFLTTQQTTGAAANAIFVSGSDVY